MEDYDKLLDRARAALPEKTNLVYVSCNVTSFARDVLKLQLAGWQLEGIWPVEMFPFTAHAEVVGKLIRK